MAQRRMFSNRIANSAKFLQMPGDSQLLYFHLILRADDDGVTEAYPIIRLLGVGADVVKVLLAKGFIRQLNEDQVMVITDWHEHNTIRADRKVTSIYAPLLKSVAPDVPFLEPKPRSDVDDNSKRLGGPSTDGIGKVRLGKVNTSNSDELPAPPTKPLKGKMKISPLNPAHNTLRPLVIKALEPLHPLESKRWYANTSEGKAVDALIDWLGEKKLMRFAEVWPTAVKEAFAPQAYKPSAILAKWPQIEKYLIERKKSGKTAVPQGGEATMGRLAEMMN